ncbi:MAG: ATP phosphoribosyltransferase regulatory subunit [Alcanivoracaceae bacterium]|jgi:ATP phosphoribosyltransferase regulatory subunit|nr:ATP phosphoribosyltransferase regulatory subunit [Alcanivoracaceae bacterium]
MNREDSWLLPEGVEEILPEAAENIESLRRRLLDTYASWGYELVFPPLIEFLDSLLNGAGRDLETETFKITDQLSGRLMGVRADITPQVARIDAHALRRKGPVRLCYCSSALRTRSAMPGGTRIPYQAGVELFGHAGLESDREVVALMVETLAAAGVPAFTLDLGHVAVFRALVDAASLDNEQSDALRAAYLRKSRVEIDELVADFAVSDALAVALRQLPWLAGDAAVIERADETLAGVAPGVSEAVDELRQLAVFLASQYPSVQLHVDLGELRGYHYHTGCLFAAYLPGQSEPLAKGGRYDHIGEVFGRARPATGFSADLKLLAGQANALPVNGILAEGELGDARFSEAVATLRAQGERVLVMLPGMTNDATELRCDRRLVFRNGVWETDLIDS